MIVCYSCKKQIEDEIIQQNYIVKHCIRQVRSNDNWIKVKEDCAYYKCPYCNFVGLIDVDYLGEAE